MRASEHASKMSCAEQANEQGVGAIEQADEQMAQHLSISCHFYPECSGAGGGLAVAMVAVHGGLGQPGIGK